MRRWLFNISSVLSLLILVAVVTVGVRSFWVLDQWSIAHARTGGSYVQVSRGMVRIARAEWPGVWQEGYSRHAPKSLLTASQTEGLSAVWFDFAGLSHGSGTVFTSETGALVYGAADGWPISETTFPLWLPAVLLAVLPSLWLITLPRHRRAVRRERGQCVACGYDLKGNTSGECPECGRVVA